MNAGAPVKISVIMPVYNRAQTLPKAVRSVLRQTLREIELLCVNDGSTDNTVMVLKKLAKNDPRVKVLSQRNAGAGPARNYGLKRAKGEFVAFLDSDDWYASDDVLAKLYEKAVEHHVQACLGGSRCAKRGTLQPLEGPGKIFFTKEALISYQDYQFTHGYCRGIYERRMLMDHNICFPPYRRFEDPPFFVSAMVCAGRFYALPDIVLIYDESRHYQKIHWDERTVTDILKGIRDVLCIAKEHAYVGLQKDFIERIRCGDWSEILAENLRASWTEAKIVMEDANGSFLEDALRQYHLPNGEKPFDLILQNIYSNNRSFLKRTMLHVWKALKSTINEGRGT
ncbi:MAG: glycosyltransferase family 2 protein [Lachnospiraceae bacterium]|nr:glycosyltransferase family 2 protein [Lachnospiraceae bacterium]